MNILHIGTPDKFTISFWEFVKNFFNISIHNFLYKLSDSSVKPPDDLLWITGGKFMYFVKFVYMANKADRIILHGLFNERVVQALFLQPWLLKKCYWIAWGGDLYLYNKPLKSKNEMLNEFFRNAVIGQIGHIVTYIKGDYELAQKWYKAKGKYHECFMYPSNLYKEYDIKPKGHNSINIQLGNSADPTNNHIDVLKNLEKYKDEDIQIFAPLSYGNQEYAKEVIAYGKDIFREKFIPLTEFMAFEKYLKFLASIDIAVFAHKRQQAMGNTITLLGLGKKVYMRSDIASWQLFDDINVKVFDAGNIEIDLIDVQTQKENQQRIKEYFSKENYLKQLEQLFEND